MFRQILTLVLAALCVAPLAACANGPPVGSAIAPAPASAMVVAGAEEYRIGPNDSLKITVFGVPDLSVDKAIVDASGSIQYPLIGSVVAGGRTTGELSQEIGNRLAAKYLQAPQVSVLVQESVSRKITVDGAVNRAGVFDLKGRTTLQQAIALAQGAARDANLKRVAIFRQVNGQRTAAVFDLTAIRSGKMEDPQVQGDDVVVVDSSALKGAWREVVSSLPAFGIFRPW